MNFWEIGKDIPATPFRQEDPIFAGLMRAVASGRKTVDEAWQQWLDHCIETGKEPVNHKREEPK